MLSSLVATLVAFFAPWNALYSDSKAIESAVTGVHLVAVLFGGGIAIAADRDTLRLLRLPGDASADVLDRLHRTHRPVLIALTVLFLSGVAMATADVNTFAHSIAFLVKMSLVTLLLINGAVLVLTERGLTGRAPSSATDALWRRLRWATRASMTLWGLIVVAGAVLVNAG